MIDKAHTWTDAELKRLEKRINAEYTKAYKEMKSQMSEIAAKIMANPDMTLAEKMTLMNKYDRLDRLCEQMATTLQDTNRAATNFVTQSMTNVYRVNYNWEMERLGLGFDILDNTAVKNILTGEVNPFTKLAIAGEKDKSVIMRKLQSEMTTSILSGESIPKIAKRLKNVAEQYLGDTVRIARTETTRIENSARNSVGERGKELGFTIYKRWVSTDDGRTRGGHLEENIKEIEVPQDDPFEIEIYKKTKDGWKPTGVVEKLMYPGDISLGASAANVVNCRCTIINVIHKKA